MTSGAILLVMASVALLVCLTLPVKLATPQDPVLGLSMRGLFWIAGGMTLVIALFCLLERQPERPAWLLTWLAVNFLVYRLGLWWEGCSGMTGLLGSVSYTFGISAKAASVLTQAAFVYLLVGSCGALVLLSQQRKLEKSLERMSCPACGGHIQFALDNLGQKVPCPHCQAIVTLRKPENLKMLCYFCKGHIEFPAHAIGTKMPCPHCEMDITLKEPA